MDCSEKQEMMVNTEKQKLVRQFQTTQRLYQQGNENSTIVQRDIDRLRVRAPVFLMVGVLFV